MEISTKEVQARIPVTIVKINGELDGSNYLDAIDRAKEFYSSGVRYLLLDLEDLLFISSAGLVAVHSMALIMSGNDAPDPENGWSTMKSAGEDVKKGTTNHLKILNPQPNVDQSLEITGFKSFLEVYTDVDIALASF